MMSARFAVGRPVADCARHAANCRQLANPFQLQTLAGQGFAGMQAQLAVGKAANLPTDANPHGYSVCADSSVGENSPLPTGEVDTPDYGRGVHLILGRRPMTCMGVIQVEVAQ